MKIQKLILIIVMLFPLRLFAFLHLEGGFGMASGSSSYKELNAGYYTDHNETILSMGIGLMARAGVKLGSISITGMAFHDWEASSLKYQPSNQPITASGTYSVTNRRLGYGPSIVFGFSGTGFSLIGEYYLQAINTIQWAESKVQNPLAANDNFSGSGFGLGISRAMGSNVVVHATYRQITYSKVTLGGVTTNISGTRFDRASWGGVFVGGSYSL